MERRDFILTGLMAGIALTGFSKNTDSDPKEPLKSFYLPPDPSPLEPVHGLDIRIKVRSSQTNLQFSSIDFAVAPKTMGPAPHVHEALDELMYVHKGTVSVLVGNEVTEVKAGGWHFRPRGIVHTFWNSGNQPVLATDMYFNQNFEDFLEELFFKIIPDMNKRNLTPMDPEIARRMEDLDKRFGVTTFGNQRQAIVDKYGLK